MIHSQIIEMSAWREYRKQAREEGNHPRPTEKYV
jgi:hypothetical protein